MEERKKKKTHVPREFYIHNFFLFELVFFFLLKIELAGHVRYF
jgi:hypothetical protein